MNNIPTVELTLTSLINDIHSGLSWLAKDDIGNGSIQAKYEATDMQIGVLRQHPLLINLEQIKFNFVVINDMVEVKEPEVVISNVAKDVIDEEEKGFGEPNQEEKKMYYNDSKENTVLEEQNV